MYRTGNNQGGVSASITAGRWAFGEGQGSFRFIACMPFGSGAYP
jgi:hypothetical protein